MSTLDSFGTPVNSDGFICGEGFARVTRSGVRDIYIIQNQEYPGDYKVSLAFYMDDFEPGNDYKIFGQPLILCEDDQIEFLGRAEEYFIPCAPLWIDRLLMVRMNPIEVGLLPTIRAIEHLHMKGVQPDEQEMLKVVKYYRDDYHHRRLVLST